MALEALSPTVITGWLACEHSLTLRLQRSSAPQAFGPFADLVRDKGTAHELAVRARYLGEGLRVLDVPGKGDQSFESWAEGSKALLESPDVDVIYQFPLVHQGIKGVADFLVRVDAEEGFSRWEPVDAKLARSEGKPGHLLQICFYAEAVESLVGAPPKEMHLELGSGARESYRFEEFGPYWRRMKLELERATESGAPRSETKPEPCSFCDYCDFQKICEAEWRAEDSLVYVANLLKADRQALEGAGIATLEALAEASATTALPAERFERVHSQAALQLEQRQNIGAPIPFRHLEPGDDPIWGHGYSHLPLPDEGDVFFDLEGHPLLTPEAGIFFLFGLLYQVDGEWTYEPIWAHDFEEQEQRAGDLVAFFEQRRRAFPGMHVYHYNHTERSSLATLTKDTEASVTFAHQASTGLYVDLLTVVRNAYQMGIESYSLKDVEKVTGYVRREVEIKAGSGAVLLYEEYLGSHDEHLLAEIAGYNEDDVRSTQALLDWLVANRPAGLRWREAVLPEYDTNVELDELEFALLSFDQGSLQHRLGNLIGYWRRERSAQFTPLREQVRQPVADLIDDPDVLTDLTLLHHESTSIDEKTGMIKERATFRFSDQELDENWGGDSVFVAGTDGETAFGTIKAFDPEKRTLDLSWKRDQGSLDLAPVSVIIDDWVRPGGKQDALVDAARQILADPGSLPPVTEELLLRHKPRFVEGGGPGHGVFSDDLDDMVSWVADLDRSVVAVQGPPGTGKTYRGARMVRKLLQAGKRVGVTAPSYVAFGNFMEAVAKVYLEHGDIDELKAAQRIKDKDDPKPFDPHIKYATSPSTVGNPKYQLVAGTSWFFCGKEMRANPVDYLVVDEAGQMSLADVAAMSLFASNVILLGDPLQLEQVSNALHPEGSGGSSLEYMLDGDLTIAPDRGVFIHETWRMHPSICHFISTQIYEDRLKSHPSCVAQVVDGHGAGLRWLEANHTENSTRSTEEAALIATKIKELMGASWTNQDGETRPLSTKDFMVVAPFNDQKDEIRRVLEEDPELAPIAPSVGTVDKFQGREAPVVFFSMTTSDGDELTRGTDFLFSRSRLNVAVSRARSLAYLVCTDKLLGTKASTVDGMRLIGTLNSFVEEAEKI
jgi:predicted RecB family nuclease